MDTAGHYRELPFDQPIRGRLLDKESYFGNVVRRVSDCSDNGQTLYAFGSAGQIDSLAKSEWFRAVGFTGSQNPTNSGFRVTHLLSQIASACDICTVSGNAYGIDFAATVGTLSHDEFSHLAGAQVGRKTFPRHVIALPSGIQSRVPRSSFVERGVVEHHGIYVSLINGDERLRSALLSPRDRLIVELSDCLIVTEAGNRGAFDTINWSIELGKPIMALDWGDNDSVPTRCSYRILRMLLSDHPKVDRLADLLTGHLDYQTNHYHFSCAHPDKRCDEVIDYSGNVSGYTSPTAVGRRLLDKMSQYQEENASPQIMLVDAKKLVPPHNGDPEKRMIAAESAMKVLLEFPWPSK